ncbi:MAG TPA: protein kinase, partial [Polyangiaceae bacterium]|nr:protein kinase [Polyangiaceae bacterium]
MAGAGEGWAFGEVIPGTDYRLVGLLGRGGFGEVFEVEHVHLTRRFAVKVLSGAHAGRGDLVERLKREARALARLHPHPNLVEAIDLRQSSDGRAFLVMERLQGRTLGQSLRVGRPVPSGPAADVMRQLLRALGAAHRLGLVHRDVKPSNVFLCEGGLVKLLDFGIVKVLSDEGGVKTTPGSAIGTPGYMAPEYIDGAAPDARSDVYGAGVVFWEMLAARPAFALRAGEGAHELLARVLTDGVPALEDEGRDDLPSALRDVVRQATARRPEARFASADDFGRALEAALRRGDVPRPARVLKASPAPAPQQGGAGGGRGPLGPSRASRGAQPCGAPHTIQTPHAASALGALRPPAPRTAPAAHVPPPRRTLSSFPSLPSRSSFPPGPPRAAGSSFPPGSSLAAGSSFPPGSSLAAGSSFPPGSSRPSSSSFPSASSFSLFPSQLTTALPPSSSAMLAPTEPPAASRPGTRQAHADAPTATMPSAPPAAPSDDEVADTERAFFGDELADTERALFGDGGGEGNEGGKGGKAGKGREGGKGVAGGKRDRVHDPGASLRALFDSNELDEGPRPLATPAPVGPRPAFGRAPGGPPPALTPDASSVPNPDRV